MKEMEAVDLLLDELQVCFLPPSLPPFLSCIHTLLPPSLPPSGLRPRHPLSRPQPFFP